MNNYNDFSTDELYAMLGVCDTDRGLSRRDSLRMAESARRIREELRRRGYGMKAV